MITRVRALDRFSHGAAHLQLMRAECAIRGAWLRGSISMGGGRGEFFTSALSAHHLRLLRFRLRAARAPLRLT
jgi:hypothetical protein